MKIGILSMHRVINYGSFLQAFALKNLIEQVGHCVDFVDIKPGRYLSGYAPIKTSAARKFIENFLTRRIFQNIQRRLLWKNFSIMMREEQAKYLDITTKSKCDKGFDAIVIGSDEVFNCNQKSSWGFTRQLYGDIDDTPIIISYAGSFGSTTVDFLNKYSLKNEVAEALSKLKAISVRDLNSCGIVQELTGKRPVMSLDPVLLHKFQIPEVERSGFMIVYAYQNRITDPKEIELIRTFAKKHGKKLISIGSYISWCDENITPKPFEVLGYFAKADYVVTDTFHGSIFSIINHCQFCVFVRPSNENKLTFLLKNLGLQSQICTDPADFDSILMCQPDYRAVDEIREKERMETLSYLNSNLNE